MLPWWLQSRRRRLLAKPFPIAWEQMLESNVIQFPLLRAAERESLRAGVRIFVAEKFWEGCRGLEINDEIKVTIAGQACLMLLGIEHDFFRDVQTILVYPTHFRIPGEHGRFEGQSHHRGPIILSWDRVFAEGRDPSSSDNLVIHEFAHQLDEMDGYINGTPYLSNREMADRWHEDMSTEYSRLVSDVQKGQNTFLGDYAATDDTEFFSVASERFFMQPLGLQEHHPTLYRLLADFYRVDPIDWFSRLESKP